MAMIDHLAGSPGCHHLEVTVVEVEEEVVLKENSAMTIKTENSRITEVV